jgi:hypothetical protein
VSSIDPPEMSQQAQLCAAMYPMAKAMLLDMHDWSFATEYVQLAELVDERNETGQWTHTYAFPSDASKIIRLFPTGGMTTAVDPQRKRIENPVMYAFIDGMHIEQLSMQNVEFVVRNDRLYTHEEMAAALVLKTSVDESKFTPSFVTALSYALAMHLGGALIKGEEGQKVVNALSKQFQYFFAMARDRDAKQQQERITFVPKWIAVR